MNELIYRYLAHTYPQVAGTTRTTSRNLPVRIDLSGGWTDTPPYCLSCGGRVINLAARLNGSLPIHVEARFLSDPILKVEAQDEEETIHLFSPSQLAGATTHRIACSVIATTLQEKNGQWVIPSPWKGLQLSYRCAVPRGSGLGVSSILAAGLITVLYDLFQVRTNVQDVTNHALLVEQLIGSGGGWQDQIGALTPGIKSISTTPEDPLCYEIVPYNVSDNFRRAMEEHLVLLYTGTQRLAATLLQDIQWDWQEGKAPVMEALNVIRESNQYVHTALQQEDLALLGTGINHYTKGKKLIHDHSITPEIDECFQANLSNCYGQGVCGAGGGGFIYLLAKDPDRIVTPSYMTRYDWSLHDGCLPPP